MRVFQIAREYAGLASGGGLGQVVAGIAATLPKKSVESVVFLPLYGFIDRSKLKKISSFVLDINKEKQKVVVYSTVLNNVDVYMFSFPAVCNKKSIYTYSRADLVNYPEATKGEGYIDNHYINLVFQLSVLSYIKSDLKKPDVLLLHDAHTGLIPGIIKSDKKLDVYYHKCKIFFLIHNAGEIYHQKMSYKFIKSFNLIKSHYLRMGKNKKEFNPLFMASILSKPLTVSPYYAHELISGFHSQNDGGFGRFLNKKSIKITGITNGVDLSVANGDYIENFTSLMLNVEQNSKLVCYGYLDDLKNPLFLFQNRITEQKGIEELITGIKEVLRLGINANFIVMGEGESRYEKRLIELSNELKGKVLYIDGYEESIAKNLFYISDFFLLTSKWEPCGITDMEASLFSTVPIVRETGGLNKVVNGVTGFKYSTMEGFLSIIQDLILKYFDDKESIDNLKNIGMKAIQDNYSWDIVVEKKYLPLFYGTQNG